MRQLECVADAASVGVVHISADLAAHHGAQNRAYDDGDRTVPFSTHLRTDDTSDHGAHDGTDRRPIAAALDDPVVIVPLVSTVADIAMTMVLVFVFVFVLMPMFVFLFVLVVSVVVVGTAVSMVAVAARLRPARRVSQSGRRWNPTAQKNHCCGNRKRNNATGHHFYPNSWIHWTSLLGHGGNCASRAGRKSPTASQMHYDRSL